MALSIHCLYGSDSANFFWPILIASSHTVAALSSKSQHSGHPQLSRHERLSGEVAIIRQPSLAYNWSAPSVFEFERHEASDRDGEVELSEHRF